MNQELVVICNRCFCCYILLIVLISFSYYYFNVKIFVKKGGGMKNLKYYVLMMTMIATISTGSKIQAFGFIDEQAEHVEHGVVYDKIDEVIDYLMHALSSIKNPQESDFIKIYDKMPQELKRALENIYLTMPIQEQDEIITNLGYDPVVLRVIIADEIQRRVVKKVTKEVNKRVKSIQKWWNSK